MTLAEIKYRNNKAGFTISGKCENIRPKQIGPVFWGFITSEQPPNGARRYTVSGFYEPTAFVSAVARNLSRDQAIEFLQKKANEFRNASTNK